MENESYREGYEQGVKDCAERIKKYYHHLSGKTMTSVVEYVIDLMAKELLNEEKCENSMKIHSEKCKKEILENE